MAMNNLPFVPWWHHPNANYEGRHRGTYRFKTIGLYMPYGLREIKLTPYEDLCPTRR